MKKVNISTVFQAIVAFTLLFFLPTATLWSQQDVRIDGQNVGTWFERYWMWITGGIILLLVLVFAGRGKNNRKRTTTTVVKDDLGNVKSVTTTEVKERQ